MGPVLINAVIHAEFSVRYEQIEQVDEFLGRLVAEVAEIPRAAAFLAGKAFLRYGAAGGPRTSMLSDFMIGAHASVLAIPILTRDVSRYRSYFPNVPVAAPPIS